MHLSHGVRGRLEAAPDAAGLFADAETDLDVLAADTAGQCFGPAWRDGIRCPAHGVLADPTVLEDAVDQVNEPIGRPTQQDLPGTKQGGLVGEGAGAELGDLGPLVGPDRVDGQVGVPVGGQVGL